MKLTFTGEAYALQRIRWDINGAVTFKGANPRPNHSYRQVWQHLRSIAEITGQPYSSLLIALRSEYGDLGGRLHFHYLVGGIKAPDPRSLCLRLDGEWKLQTKGSAEIQPVCDLLKGVAYITKFAIRDDVDALERNGAVDQVTLSRSVRMVIRKQDRMRRDALSALAKKRRS